MSLTFDLSGQTALVTGCKRGIGLAICKTLAEAGADIIGVSASLEARGSDAETAVRAEGRAFTAHQCDFSNRDATLAFASEMESRGDISILVNNAGTIRRAPAATHPLDDWDHVQAVNSDAPFILTQALGRSMLTRGSGKIVFVASVLSFQGGINVPGYAASKGAIAQLVRAFANEWAAKGINVNGVAPGYVATDNTAALHADPDRNRSLMERIPVQRWGSPYEIAEPIAFLCSDLAHFIHGTILPVDGGWMSR